MIDRSQKRRENTLVVVCLFATAMASLWWLVNVDVALQYFRGSGILPSFSPLRMPYKLLASCSKDYTTASPLLILLTFAFPLLVWNSVRRKKPPPKWLADGYPRHWTVFVIYVGLAATLFGMILALSAVGVDSAENQREQLMRLIAGTATALVSSFVAIIAAFFSYVLKGAMKACQLIVEQQVIRPQDSIARLSERLENLLPPVSSLKSEMEEVAGQLNNIKNSMSEPLDQLRAAMKDVGSELTQFADKLGPFLDHIGSFGDSAQKTNSLLENISQCQQETLVSIQEQQSQLAALNEELVEGSKTLLNIHKHLYQAHQEQKGQFAESVLLQQKLLDCDIHIMDYVRSVRDTIEQEQQARRRAAEFLLDRSADGKSAKGRPPRPHVQD